MDRERNRADSRGPLGRAARAMHRSGAAPFHRRLMLLARRLDPRSILRLSTAPVEPGFIPRLATGHLPWGSVLVVAMPALLAASCGERDREPTGPDGTDGAFVYPLETGTRWTYSDPSGGTGSTVEVVGEEEIGGERYACLIRDGETEPSRCLRQSGDVLWLFPQGGEPPEDPGFSYLRDAFDRSYPWAWAFLDTVPGTRWTLVEVDTTAMLEGFTWELLARTEGIFVGPEAVTTPAGSWEGALRYRLESEISVAIFGFDPSRSTIEEDVWLVDGIGAVRSREIRVIQEPGGQPTTTEREEVLESFLPPR